MQGVDRPWATQQVIEPRLSWQIQDALGVIGCGIIHAAAAAGGSDGLLQPGAVGAEANLGKAQKNKSKDSQTATSTACQGSTRNTTALLFSSTRGMMVAMSDTPVYENLDD